MEDVPVLRFSNEGLIFTNHHCGFGAIQQLSSVEHDYLKDGFVSQSKQEELPVPGLSVRYLKETVDVSDRINSQIAGIEDEFQRLSAADSIGRVICDSVGNNEFLAADVVPFYSNNKYFLVVYDVYRDVRMVFARLARSVSSVGIRTTGCGPAIPVIFPCSVCTPTRIINRRNTTRIMPYTPRYVAEVSMQGYQDKGLCHDNRFSGKHGSLFVFLGVQQRIENSKAPYRGAWHQAGHLERGYVG